MTTKQSVLLASASALSVGVAQGAVVSSGLLNLKQDWSSTDPTPPMRQPIDMTGDGTNDFTFGYDANTLKPYVDTRTSVSTQIPVQSGIVGLFEKPGSKGFPVTPVGTMIDATYKAAFPLNDARGYMYQDDSQAVAGDWSNTAVTDAFVGIQLTLGDGIHYGWLRFIDNPTSNPTSLTLVDWAYEGTPNQGILTVPEPSLGALAGLGSAALLLRRRKQSA